MLQLEDRTVSLQCRILEDRLLCSLQWSEGHIDIVNIRWVLLFNVASSLLEVKSVRSSSRTRCHPDTLQLCLSGLSVKNISGCRCSSCPVCLTSGSYHFVP